MGFCIFLVCRMNRGTPSWSVNRALFHVTFVHSREGSVML